MTTSRVENGKNRRVEVANVPDEEMIESVRKHGLYMKYLTLFERVIRLEVKST